jgi:hypothetical protein
MTQLQPPRPESVDAVVARITSGMNIFVHGAAATLVLAEINASMPRTHGRMLTERGELLMSIAHPDFRGELTEKLRGLKRFIWAGPDRSRGWATGTGR